MPGSPILPSNIHDPTGQDRRERGAINVFGHKLKQVQSLYLALLKSLPSRRMAVNAADEMYLYEITPELLAQTLAGVAEQTDRILLDGFNLNQLWFNVDYVVPAYQQGTAQQLTNLSTQSATYAASRPSVQALLSTPAYQTRVAFLKLRNYDSMKGFANGVSTSMGQVLQDGLVTGKGAREIARNLVSQTGISYRRAELIARTEIPGALRQARLEEADQATRDLGIKSKEMHMSALSPSTRPDHRARHSKLYTTQEQREWWSVDGNRYRCKCSTVTILVDDNGKPLTPGIVDRAYRMLAANPPPAVRVKG